MYLTIEEAAEYLSIHVADLQKLIFQGKVRIVDGEDGEVLVNKEQFNTHLDQLEKYKALAKEYLSQPIPEDKDVKDED